MKRTFYVKALWDEEVKVWYSETDIKGLFIETKTLAEFEDIMPELARDMIFANHTVSSDLAKTSLQDLFATITWIPPQPVSSAT